MAAKQEDHPMKLKCPSCGGQIDVPGTTPGPRVTCSTCGKAFRLKGENPPHKKAVQRTVATLPPATKDCPYCAEAIRTDAQECEHCGSSLAEQVETINESKADPNGYKELLSAHVPSGSTVSPSGESLSVPADTRFLRFLLGGAVGAVLLFILIVVVSGMIKDRQRQAELAELKNQVDQAISVAQSHADKYEFPKASSALDAIEERLRSASAASDELEGRLAEAARKVREAEDDYNRKIADGCMVFEGRLVLPEEKARILKERQVAAEEEAEGERLKDFLALLRLASGSTKEGTLSEIPQEVFRQFVARLSLAVSDVETYVHVRDAQRDERFDWRWPWDATGQNGKSEGGDFYRSMAKPIHRWVTTNGETTHGTWEPRKVPFGHVYVDIRLYVNLGVFRIMHCSDGHEVRTSLRELLVAIAEGLAQKHRIELPFYLRVTMVWDDVVSKGRPLSERLFLLADTRTQPIAEEAPEKPRFAERDARGWKEDVEKGGSSAFLALLACYLELGSQFPDAWADGLWKRALNEKAKLPKRSLGALDSVQFWAFFCDAPEPNQEVPDQTMALLTREGSKLGVSLIKSIPADGGLLLGEGPVPPSVATVQALFAQAEAMGRKLTTHLRPYVGIDISSSDLDEYFDRQRLQDAIAGFIEAGLSEIGFDEEQYKITATVGLPFSAMKCVEEKPSQQETARGAKEAREQVEAR